MLLDFAEQKLRKRTYVQENKTISFSNPGVLSAPILVKHLSRRISLSSNLAPQEPCFGLQKIMSVNAPVLGKGLGYHLTAEHHAQICALPEQVCHRSS